MSKKKPTAKAKPVKTASKAKSKANAVKPAPEKPAADTPAKTDKVVKKAQFIAMLQRDEGATLQQLIDFTKWKRPSVHGFISNLRRIDKMKIDQTKESGKDMVYRLAA